MSWSCRLLLCVVCLLLGCEDRAESSYSYYDARIAPVLDVGCQRQTTGCHVDDGRGFALGNLDLRSYDALMQRQDVLPPIGPYPVGLLLLKAGDAVQIDVRTIDPPDPSQPDRRRVSVRSDIRHAAGSGAIAQGSRNYSLLQQWIAGGYSRSGVAEPVLRESEGACSHTLLERAYIDTSAEPRAPNAYQRFVREVSPVLTQRCAGSSCHGSTTADLYLTCGETPAEQRWNYEVAVRYLDDVAAASELLLRPLASSAGGVFHEGGDVFADVMDPDYRSVLSWAEAAVAESPELTAFGAADEGLRFFANRVQPTLVRKGCMFLNCHSPAMFHDLRLSIGARGFFSEIATRRNHELSRAQLALDSADPNQSRLIAKNLCPLSARGRGIAHRGGALLEDFAACGADEALRAQPAQCADVDADSGDLSTIPAYCVLARWHAIERAQHVQRGELPERAAPRGVVFVTRPPGIGGSADFDTFRPGADLLLADATESAAGELQLGAARSLLAGCGLSGSVDVRGPAVSWDATRVAFAARRSEAEPLRLYQLQSDGSRCAPLAALDAGATEANGIPIHDFDPSYAPDGRLVFASTRGNADSGPTRTPAALTPNANLYVSEASGVRQLTFLSNQELAPSFLSDGRVIFTTEKRALDFHQFAARRQNLDGGDYHPLIAQRPSVGFESATELVELPDRNLALVAAPLAAADGGGSIVLVNRSIGPDQADRDPRDRAYIHALTALTDGVYRSPAALPSGRLLTACDPTASDVTSGPHHYDLCELDGRPGRAPRVLFHDAQRVALEPAPLWVRAPRSVFQSRRDEPNGSTQIAQGQRDAVVQVSDFPLLTSLLFANTRVGRTISPDVQGLALYASEPPPSDARDLATLSDGVVSDRYGRYFERLRTLGRAPLAADGSVRMRVPAGTPLQLGVLDARGELLEFVDGAPFSGPMRQREELQFYPGERVQQSLPRPLFNGFCGGCHGSISGRELDVVVNVDVLTRASSALADDDPIELR